jgi:hypothetical protein
MKSFTEYIEDKEYNEMLNESAPDIIGKGIVYGSAALYSAWAISALAVGIRKIGSKTWTNLKSAFGLSNEQVNNLKSNFNKQKNNQSLNELKEKTEQTNRKYEEQLKSVYEAIDLKDWATASDEFHALTKAEQNIPAIKQAIIDEIIKVCKEPPVYTQSPGNITYKAIKQVIDIQTARGAAVIFAKKIKDLSGEENE